MQGVVPVELILIIVIFLIALYLPAPGQRR
jgi:hypothetical protein